MSGLPTTKTTGIVTAIKALKALTIEMNTIPTEKINSEKLATFAACLQTCTNHFVDKQKALLRESTPTPVPFLPEFSGAGAGAGTGTGTGTAGGVAESKEPEGGFDMPVAAVSTSAYSTEDETNTSSLSANFPFMALSGRKDLEDALASLDAKIAKADPLPELNEALFNFMAKPPEDLLRNSIPVIQNWLNLLQLDPYMVNKSQAPGSSSLTYYLTHEWLGEHYIPQYDEIQTMSRGQLPPSEILVNQLIQTQNWQTLAQIALKHPTPHTLFTRKIIYSLLTVNTEDHEQEKIAAQNALLTVLKIRECPGLETLADEDTPEAIIISDIHLLIQFHRLITQSENTTHPLLNSFFPDPGAGKSVIKAAIAGLNEHVFHRTSKEMRLGVTRASQSIDKINVILENLEGIKKPENQRAHVLRALFNSLNTAAGGTLAMPDFLLKPEITRPTPPPTTTASDSDDDAQPTPTPEEEFENFLNFTKLILMSMQYLLALIPPPAPERHLEEAAAAGAGAGSGVGTGFTHELVSPSSTLFRTAPVSVSLPLPLSSKRPTNPVSSGPAAIELALVPSKPKTSITPSYPFL